MRRLTASVVLLAALALPGAALAKDDDISSIAGAVEREIVYVSPAAHPGLTVAEAGQIRLEILRRDIGRIKIAIVSEDQAKRAGGVTALANTLAARLGIRGTLLVKGGSRVWLVTSYSDTNAATQAVKKAFDANGSLVDELLDSVRGLAAIDPRTDAHPPSPAPAPPNSAPIDTSKPFSFHVPTLLILAIIGGPVIAVLLVVGLRRWQASSAARETFDDDLADARQNLVALGDDITELDLAESMPDADPRGKQAYDDAVVQYQRAERLLGEKVNPRRLARANAALTEGRRLMDSARARFEGVAGSTGQRAPRESSSGADVRL